jgi:hypothetical protein
MEKEVMKCCVCQEIHAKTNLVYHIKKKHPEYTLQRYYCEFIDTSKNGICKFCGVNPANFLSIHKGFRLNCKDQECFKKSLRPYSLEFRMKVFGQTEEEYLIWKSQLSEKLRIQTAEGFARARQEDPDFDKKNSKYCKEFWMNKGHSEEESVELAYNETQKNRNKLKEIRKEDPDYQKGKSWSSYKYWMERGMDEKSAKEHVKKAQATFTLEKCIEKYGEEEGRKKWQERQEKWMKSNKKTNFSKASQNLFWKLVERQPSLANESIFATNNQGQKDDSGKNHEMTLTLESIAIKPDFIVMSTKKIIEFDGHYWHSDAARKTYGSTRISNPAREKKKEEEISKSGYKLLRVGEMEFRENPETIIEKCLQFLNE